MPLLHAPSNSLLASARSEAVRRNLPSSPPAEFWLHPADVMRFKAEAIKHLPVLIFGDRQKLTEGKAARA